MCEITPTFNSLPHRFYINDSSIPPQLFYKKDIMLKSTYFILTIFSSKYCVVVVNESIFLILLSPVQLLFLSHCTLFHTINIVYVKTREMKNICFVRSYQKLNGYERYERLFRFYCSPFWFQWTVCNDIFHFLFNFEGFALFAFVFFMYK